MGLFNSAVTREIPANSDINVLVVFDADESIDDFIEKLFLLKPGFCIRN